MAKLYTKNGHDMFEMRSLLQKAIRRCDYVNAGYAANELMGRYRNYLWKSLLTISAEDCWGCVTHEIIALKKADDAVNANYSGYDVNPLFVAKAVTLLVKARKNRDADYFACCLLNSNDTLSDDYLRQYFSLCERDFKCVPDYTYDCHTRKGKAMGKTKMDMIKSEQAALYPRTEGDFDEADWSPFFKHEKEGFDKEKGFPMPTKEQLKELDSGCMQMNMFD